MAIISLIILIFLVSPMITNAFTEAPIDVTTMDISDISSALNDNIITSYQLVNIYLDRISTYDDNYNSINQINSKALEIAKELDEERNNGNVRGILHGIPILVKTNIDVEGLATTDGAKALLDNYPIESANVIKKLIDAGAIILGSTNMSEFAFLSNTSKSSFGSVKNAWNNLYTPYGSSGGSAVAVALSFASAAIGTDTNSSIRVPSSANNVVGLRSSFGYLSTKGIIPYDTTRDVVGPITKTVKDTAILLSIMNDEDKDYIQYTNNNDLSDITIGIPNNIAKGTGSYGIYSKTYSEIYDLFTDAISNYEELGAKIVYLDNFYPSKYTNISISTQSGKTFCSGFNEYIKNTTGTIRSFSALEASNKKIYSLDGYLESCNNISDLDERYKKNDIIRNYLNDYYNSNEIDVILYPTTKNKLIKLSNTNNEQVNAISKYISSATGYPTINIPLGFDSDNLPYGMELLALINQEDLLIKVSSVYDSTYNKIIIPNEVPNLYDIDEKTKYIVENYQVINNNNSNKQLIKETKEYFSNYNQDIDNTSLYNKYLELESNNKFNIYKWIAIITIVYLAMQQLMKVDQKKKTRKRKKRRYR